MRSTAIILTLRLFAENAEIVGGSRIRDLGTERDRWRDKGKQEKHGIVETGRVEIGRTIDRNSQPNQKIRAAQIDTVTACNEVGRTLS